MLRSVSVRPHIVSLRFQLLPAHRLVQARPPSLSALQRIAVRLAAVVVVRHRHRQQVPAHAYIRMAVHQVPVVDVHIRCSRASRAHRLILPPRLQSRVAHVVHHQLRPVAVVSDGCRPFHVLVRRDHALRGIPQRHPVVQALPVCRAVRVDVLLVPLPAQVRDVEILHAVQRIPDVSQKIPVYVRIGVRLYRVPRHRVVPPRLLHRVASKVLRAVPAVMQRHDLQVCPDDRIARTLLHQCRKTYQRYALSAFPVPASHDVHVRVFRVRVLHPDVPVHLRIHRIMPRHHHRIDGHRVFRLRQVFLAQLIPQPRLTFLRLLQLHPRRLSSARLVIYHRRQKLEDLLARLAVQHLYALVRHDLVPVFPGQQQRHPLQRFRRGYHQVFLHSAVRELVFRVYARKNLPEYHFRLLLQPAAPTLLRRAHRTVQNPRLQIIRIRRVHYLRRRLQVRAFSPPGHGFEDGLHPQHFRFGQLRRLFLHSSGHLLTELHGATHKLRLQQLVSVAHLRRALP